MEFDTFNVMVPEISIRTDSNDLLFLQPISAETQAVAWAEEVLSVVASLKRYGSPTRDANSASTRALLSPLRTRSALGTSRSSGGDSSGRFASKFARVGIKVLSAKGRVMRQYDLKLDLSAFAKAGADRRESATFPSSSSHKSAGREGSRADAAVAVSSRVHSERSEVFMLTDAAAGRKAELHATIRSKVLPVRRPTPPPPVQRTCRDGSAPGAGRAERAESPLRLAPSAAPRRSSGVLLARPEKMSPATAPRVPPVASGAAAHDRRARSRRPL